MKRRILALQSRKLLALILIPLIVLGLIPTGSHALPPPGFSITSGTPSGGTLTEGSTASQTITVTSLNGYKGQTNLVVSVAPRSGFACSLTPTFVVLNPGASAIASLNCQANSAGTGTANYAVTVVGFNETFPNVKNQTAAIPYIVTTPLFGVSANPTSVNAAAGTSTGMSTIMITRMNSFSGTITLAAQGPAGFSCSFSPASVTATATSVMTCGGSFAGANHVTINATATSPAQGLITVFHQTGLVYNLEGIVCLTDPGTVTSSSACPTTRALTGMNSLVAGTQLRVAVALNDSVGVNGFQIVLWADHSILQPFDADLTGTVLAGTLTTLAKCIGGVLRQGSACSPNDTLDTIELTAVSTQVTGNPTTGLLFTAVYNIKANNTTPIKVGFQTGCGSVQIPTSVPPICVTLINGGILAAPEFGTLNATYTSDNTRPIFGIKAKQTLFTFAQGTPGTQMSAISQTEINGFSCGGLSCVDLSTVATSATGLPPGLSAILTPSISDPAVLNGTLSVSITRFAAPGVFPIYLVGKPDALNTPFTGTTYLGSAVVVTVIVAGTPDFSISLNPQTLLIPTGTSASSNVTLTSLNQFSGTGTLMANVIPACCPGAPFPTATLVPNSFTLTSGGMFTGTLIITASNTPPPGGSSTWIVIVNATSGSLNHSAISSVKITAPPPPPDQPPIASFTLSPTSPIAGQQVFFDGSGSRDPDGFVTSWQWNFGDGFIGFGEFFNHAFTNSGSFTVVLTVTDNAGLSGSTSTLVIVRAQPLHDVSIVSVNVIPSVVVSDQTASVEVAVRNDGLRNETVSVTAFFDSHVIGTVNGVFIQAGNCGFFNCNPVFVNIAWDTTGVVAGNYTISATVFLANDPTPADNTLKDGTVRVLPPPVLTLTPSSGSLGTLVTVHGSGFPNPSQGPFFSLVEIQMTFDDQLLGFFFLQGGSFNFTFDVPHAQAGIVHHVHAIELFPFNLNVQADFLVLSEPGNLSVSVDTGAIYFPGDTAVIYVLTSQGGVPVGPANVQLQITLVLPNGTNVGLIAKSVSTGLFKATYALPTTGSLGTYGLVVAAHSSAGNGSALAGFEVKPTWLSQHGTTIMGATAIAGVVGVVALAWQKGYLSRRKDQPSSLPF